MNDPQSQSTTFAAASTETASAADCAHAASAVIRRQLTHRPYAALGVAVGLGFVAAGGLASPAVWGLARLGARVAFAAATRKLGEVLLEDEAAPAQSAIGGK